MRSSFLRFHKIAFGFESAPEALFQHLNLHLSSGWCGVVGANGSGKTTLLHLAVGILQPNQGLIEHPPNSLYCPQRTDSMPEEFVEFCREQSRIAIRTRSRLGIQEGWCHRWETLSHGERKRAQIGIALWREPLLLAVDEPTNHLDATARAIIASALGNYRGVGLLVSHDRELLDGLCLQILFLEPPNVVLQPGGYTKAAAQIRQDKNSRCRQRTLKKQSLAKLKRESIQRRRLAGQHRSKRSKKGITLGDHDAKEKVNRARLTGKDAVGGKLRRQMAGRLRKAQKELDAMPVMKEAPLGIWLPGSVSRRDLLLGLPANRLALGGGKELCFPDLYLAPRDRIAVTGDNGSGKSTLADHIVKHVNLPHERVTYLPQEIDEARSRWLLDRVRALPPNQLGHLMTIVSRLGSLPERLLGSRLPSPGEVRKLCLAMGMLHEPQIVIMDEPTNHMDLPSIECLESALKECPGCLVLVSHDRRFLSTLTCKEWHIEKAPESLREYRLRIC
jgi:ATPase subunit of ABC transporter with duplicated ATPase domains